MSPGVYIITNTESGKVYIGSTAGFRQRWAEHGRHLRRGIHHNPYLQSAWNYYGEAAFEFGVLEYLNGPEEFHLAEQWWMDVYREEGKELYNFGLAARSPRRGCHHSEEAKQRMSEAHRGKAHSEETRRKIGEANRGRKKPPRTKEHCRKISEANAEFYPAFIHQDTGEIIPAGFNLEAMCRERGLGQNNMCAVKNGRRQRHRGWILY